MDLTQNMLPGAQCSLDLPEDLPPSSFDMDLVPGSIKGAMKAAGATSRDLWYYPHAMLRRIPDFNVRVKDAEYWAHVNGIANSIEKDGYKPSHPLEGYAGKDADGTDVIWVTDGYCRMDAVDILVARKVPLDDLPVVVVPPKTTSMVDLTIGLIRHNSGKRLRPYEEGLVLKRLFNWGWEVSAIADRFDMDVSYVKLLLELVSMPRGIIAMVMAGNVAPTVAVQEYRKHGAETVNVLNHGLAAAQAAAAAAGKPVEKAKYTPKHKPGAGWAKVVKSQSEPLYMVAKAVVADPGFKGLTEDTRKSLQELIDSLKAKEEELAQKEAEIQAQLAKANAEGGDGQEPAGTETHQDDDTQA
ncbi:TPA: hypothetical protein ACXI6Y_005245 [Pseudomonas aeruginosa]